MKGGPLAAWRLLGNGLLHWTQGLEIPIRAGSLTPPCPRRMTGSSSGQAPPTWSPTTLQEGTCHPGLLQSMGECHTRTWQELGSGVRETWVEP